MDKVNIGIIGIGVVGSAVEYGFSPQTGCDFTNLRVYDKDKNKSRNSLEETVNESEFIFLSVPTPANQDGSIITDIIESAIKDIDSVNKSSSNIILIRSTVTPGTTRKIQKMYPNLNIVFNPEFLTERSAKFDFINQSRLILGGENKHTNKVVDLYKTRFGKSFPCIQTNYETAEMIKYMNNCFFATKVSFMNEMKLIADMVGVEWEVAVDGWVRDGRIGHTHLQVPGPDGKPGFGGSCFPKDIQAMISLGDHYGIEMNTLQGAWETNKMVRPDKDWEKLEGRAVVKKDETNGQLSETDKLCLENGIDRYLQTK